MDVHLPYAVTKRIAADLGWRLVSGLVAALALFQQRSRPSLPWLPPMIRCNGSLLHVFFFSITDM